MGRFIHIACAAAFSGLVSASSLAVVTPDQWTRGSFVSASVGNYDEDLGKVPTTLALSSSYDGDGGQASTILSPTSFEGLDSSSTNQTMTFSGSAHATGTWRILRTEAIGQVTHAFYNPYENDPYLTYNSDGSLSSINESGVPDSFLVVAMASFKDTLQYGGTAVGYNSRYTFHIHGDMTGGNVATYLNVTINGHLESFSIENQTGAVSEIFTTNAYPVTGTGQTMEVFLTSEFRLNASDGDFMEGDDYSGGAYFGQTVTLSSVDVVDDHDNAVSGWTLSSGSGTNYVPEPASALGLGALSFGLLVRRRPQG